MAKRILEGSLMFCLRTICAWTLLAGLSIAGEYEFTKIVDQAAPGQPFYVGLVEPRISNDGTVFFTASRALDEFDTKGVNGIFAGNGGAIRTVVDSSGPFALFREISVSGKGDVAFEADLDDGTSGVYWTDGVSVKTIADNKLYPDMTFRLPDINDLGQVAMFGYPTDRPGFQLTIYRGDGGPLTTIAQPGDTFRELSGAGVPSINVNGEVGFAAWTRNDEYGIFVSNGVDTKTLYHSVDGDFSFPTLNDSGDAAFFTYLGGGDNAVVTGNGGPFKIVADSLGPIDSFLNPPGNPSFSNSGEVAFIAFPQGLPLSILTGPDPVADKVFASGDTLFGVKTIGANISRGLNDNGQLAMRVQQNGRFVLVRADPVPEPTTWLLALLGFTSLLAWKRLGN